MKKVCWAIGVTLAILTGCDQSKPTPAIEQAPKSESITETAPETALIIDFASAAQAFQTIAIEQSQQLVQHCTAMKVAIDRFIDTPNDDTQLAAQALFTPCYQQWARMAPFFQQPFDYGDKKSFTTLTQLLDTRPSLPGYIDGIPDYPYSGLVHELDIELNEDNLRSQHRLMDEESASVGFPVIEFFLWKSPASEHWQPTTAQPENVKIVARRKQYLGVASDLLLQNLTNAVLRWQSESEFKTLPERAQLSFVLKSLQRFTLIELLQGYFEPTVFEDPNWFHPAPYSGQGRQYLMNPMTTLQTLFAADQDAGLYAWVESSNIDDLSAQALLAQINTTVEALKALPENYPIGAEDSPEWESARQAIAQLSVQFATLSKHYQIAIVTE